MALLSGVFSPSTRSRESLVLIESTLATPWLPFLQAIIATPSTSTVVCVCLLHPPIAILPTNLDCVIIDWTDNLLDYEDRREAVEPESLLNKVCDAVVGAPDGPVCLIIDSPDTLLEDVGSVSQTFDILERWYSDISHRSAPSRIVLPLSSKSRLFPFLITPTFAPSMAHLILHPPSLLLHIFTDYLTLPPPRSPPTKFWPIFSGLTARDEAERLVWGTEGSGWVDEIVVEILIRTNSGKKMVDRSLEGWRKAGECSLEELDQLRSLWLKNTGSQQSTADLTQDLPFNLSLTEVQQHSRAQVPLPYAHEGQPGQDSAKAAAIFYDPDSADDIDEDDPDEDLDI